MKPKQSVVASLLLSVTCFFLPITKAFFQGHNLLLQGSFEQADAANKLGSIEQTQY